MWVAGWFLLGLVRIELFFFSLVICTIRGERAISGGETNCMFVGVSGERERERTCWAIVGRDLWSDCGRVVEGGRMAEIRDIVLCALRMVHLVSMDGYFLDDCVCV